MCTGNICLLIIITNLEDNIHFLKNASTRVGSVFLTTDLWLTAQDPTHELLLGWAAWADYITLYCNKSMIAHVWVQLQ